MDTNQIIHLICLDEVSLLKQLIQQPFKATGPGGQKKNKTLSAMRLTFEQLDIKAECSKYRHLSDNKKSALRKIRCLIALQNKQFIEPTVEVTPYLKNKLHIQDSNPHLALLFYFIVGAFYFTKGDDKEASVLLLVTRSALLRFLKEHKDLFQKVNHIRQTFDKGPLK